MIVTTKELFKHAYGKYAVGAYNINNAEQAMGLFRGCIESKSPFIVQISKGARSYTDKRMLEAILRAADQIFPDAIFAVHLDHGDEAACIDCINSGFYSSVMIDASHESYEKNIEITRRIVQAAHAKGIVVEAELGQLGGVEEHVSVSEDQAHLTDPNQAKDFVTRSGCDSLACAIGTSHGAFKSTVKDADGNVLPPTLAMDRIREIHKRMPNCHMVMHGSSSVPKSLVDIINQYGGNMPGTAGIPVEKIREGIDHGVRKVNVDTDSRLAMTGAIRKVFVETPGKFDPRDYLKPAREAAKQVYLDRMVAFGQAGHAGDYKPMSLEAAKKLYKK